MGAVMAAKVVSVNVGTPRTFQWRGQLVESAIWKQPVIGEVRIEGVNLVGDDQADRRVHGGMHKAVYAYSVEDYDWWAATTGPLAPGTFGENLTTAGIDLNTSHIGDRWHVGSTVLEMAQPRRPCFKLGIRMGDDGFPRLFTLARRPGAYLRIVSEGTITEGDAIHVEPAEQPAIAIGDLVSGEASDEVLRRVVDDHRVPPGWRDAAERALARADDRG
jgi:MOSC domain-containing protein YiiM